MKPRRVVWRYIHGDLFGAVSAIVAVSVVLAGCSATQRPAAFPPTSLNPLMVRCPVPPFLQLMMPVRIVEENGHMTIRVTSDQEGVESAEMRPIGLNREDGFDHSQPGSDDPLPPTGVDWEGRTQMEPIFPVETPRRSERGKAFDASDGYRDHQ